MCKTCDIRATQLLPKFAESLLFEAIALGLTGVSFRVVLCCSGPAASCRSMRWRGAADQFVILKKRLRRNNGLSVKCQQTCVSMRPRGEWNLEPRSPESFDNQETNC